MRFITIFFVILTINHSLGQLLELFTIPPDMDKLTHQFIASRGFNWQFYSVPTKDGYVIGLYRIVHPHIRATKRPVLMYPVGGGYSEEWLRNSEGGNVNEPLNVVGPNIGFEAAKRGHDVWLGDWRGNFYDAYLNDNYTMNDIEFYDYSFDEYALFDLAAAIDFVRSVTGSHRIAYVGLIDSTTPYFMLASMVPRFNDVVQPVIQLCPSWDQSYSYPTNSITRKQYKKQMTKLIKKRGPSSPIIQYISYVSLCQLVIVQKAICNPVIYQILKKTFTDGKVGSVNYDRMSIYLFSGLGIGSNWISAQAMDMSFNPRFTMLDVGKKRNRERYGGQPPEYMPERITNPEIHMMTGKSQSAYTENDLKNFESRLGTKIRSKPLIPASVSWSGLSFQDGAPADVVKYVNIPVLKILDSYN